MKIVSWNCRQGLYNHERERATIIIGHPIFY